MRRIILLRIILHHVAGCGASRNAARAIIAHWPDVIEARAARFEASMRVVSIRGADCRSARFVEYSRITLDIVRAACHTMFV